MYQCCCYDIFFSLHAQALSNWQKLVGVEMHALKRAHKYSHIKKMDWFDSSNILFLCNYEEFAEQKGKTMRRRNKLMRKKGRRKKSRLSRAIDKKEKHVHCVNRKQQHASIVLKRRMKWTQASTKQKRKESKRMSE